MPRRRLTQEERGYGRKHQILRKKWARRVATGEVYCARQGPKCEGMPILPDQPWDLGHDDTRQAYTGPECIPCNRGAGGARGAAVTNARRKAVRREW